MIYEVIKELITNKKVENIFYIYSINPLSSGWKRVFDGFADDNLLYLNMSRSVI